MVGTVMFTVTDILDRQAGRKEHRRQVAREQTLDQIALADRQANIDLEGRKQDFAERKFKTEQAAADDATKMEVMGRFTQAMLSKKNDPNAPALFEKALSNPYFSEILSAPEDVQALDAMYQGVQNGDFSLVEQMAAATGVDTPQFTGMTQAVDEQGNPVFVERDQYGNRRSVEGYTPPPKSGQSFSGETA